MTSLNDPRPPLHQPFAKATAAPSVWPVCNRPLCLWGRIVTGLFPPADYKPATRTAWSRAGTALAFPPANRAARVKGLSMLVLTRKPGQRVVIDGRIVVTVLECVNGLVRLGIKAPREVRIVRAELTSDSLHSGD